MEEEFSLAKLCREGRIIQHKQELQHAHKQKPFGVML